MKTIQNVDALTFIEEHKNKPSNPQERGLLATKLAEIILEEANRIQSSEEKKQMAELARMIDDPQGKIFTTCMNDECFRSNNNYRIADQICHLLEKHGTPKFLDTFSKVQMEFFKVCGKPLADILIPMIRTIIRKKTSRVIIPGEPKLIEKHISQRKKEGITTNLNHLGEAILGEEEATKRLNTYIKDLKKPSVEYISVKISTIYSQLNTLSWEDTVENLAVRLRKLYRVAIENPYISPEGKPYAKFINLDMEEYRDLKLTIDLFKKVLDENEFLQYRAGIVLQAYLPDSYESIKELTEWSQRRLKKGGSPIKVRLVKGANLCMEEIESSTRDWPQPTFSEKVEVDANFKKILDYSLTPERATAVNIGIASHNLFDLSYALLIIKQRQVEMLVEFEMLEGMAEHIRVVLQKLVKGIILYCPAAGADEFQHAIAYLIRRLDEQTAPQNFLRHAFDLKPGTKKFAEQSQFFIQGCELIEKIDNTPRRQQNRQDDNNIPSSDNTFRNEPDTDYSLKQNIEWAHKNIYTPVKQLINGHNEDIPIVIGQDQITTTSTREVISPNSGQPFCKASLATEEHIERALTTATKAFAEIDQGQWQQRCLKLKKAAQIIRETRAEILTAMIADSGKTVLECDPEISEAIDFLEYYARNFEEWQNLKNIDCLGKGVILITPPWNFPFAIPLGGVAAALVTGNSVIFKPAPETPLSAWKAAEVFYKAGFNREELQFIICDDEPHGSQLIKDERISSVILTGATETAQLFMKLQPGLDLMAETGGKNCMIVTDLCDRDLAVKHIVDSAFGHSGQKCSACSILLLEESLYNDEHFIHLLRDTAASRKVGPGSDPESIINPLITPAQGKLLHGLTTLEEGEEWLLKPKQDPNNTHVWTPGIKMNVKPESNTFKTEFFGPLLAVVSYQTLDEAIAIANSSHYGLTGGIHTLDKREQKKWADNIEVGNAYICRSITGAIVQRQPFGGYKKSAYGRGFKAGGPNYLTQLMTIVEINEPTKGNKHDLENITKIYEKIDPKNVCALGTALQSYQEAWDNYFSIDHDPSQILGQHNILRYRPHSEMTVMILDTDKAYDIYRTLAAALTAKCKIKIVASMQKSKELLLEEIACQKQKLIDLTIVDQEEAIKHFSSSPMARVRIIGKPPQSWLQAASEKFIHLQSIPVYSTGRLELLNYVRPTAFSIDYHRYGNLDNK